MTGKEQRMKSGGRVRWVLPGFIVVLLAGVAWSRVGLLDLPSVPRDVTLEASGLTGLDALARLDEFVRDESIVSRASDELGSLGFDDKTTAAVQRVHEGWVLIKNGTVPGGLATMREGLRLAPSHLVLSNAYRMIVFRLQREYLRTARERGLLMPQFPPELDGEPIGFLKELDDAHSSRETRLSLALSWVDRMLLFPALEIKAPSSVEAVYLLTKVIDEGNPNYVPALFARGLNHLHRPARLVWPESDKTPPDAAAQDIGRCIAIGRRLGVGSPRLQASLAIALGDGYIKAGRFSVARSWWQIAQNLSGDDDLQAGIRRRYAWRDEEVLDRLEEELDRAWAALDQPMTDLALMWK